MSALDLGINNCFAVKRWPESHRWTAVIRNHLNLSLVQYSLDLVDLSMSKTHLSRIAKQVRKACAYHGIIIHSVFTGLNAYQSNLLLSWDSEERKHGLLWYKKAAWFAAELGCDRFGGHMGALSCDSAENPVKNEFIMNSFCDSIGVLTQYAKKAGISNLTVEFMPVVRERTATLDAARDFFTSTKKAAEISVDICLDTGHQCAWGNTESDREFANWCKHFSSHVSMLHLQQNDGDSDQHLPFTQTHNAAGIVLAADILNTLEAFSMSPSLFLEIIHPHEAQDLQVIRDLIVSAGYWKLALSEKNAGSFSEK